MENKKIGIGIIGAGAVAPAHIAGYLAYPELCEIRAVCNSTVEKAEKLIAENGLDAASAVSDYRELLAMPEIEAVSICLPPSMHAQVTVDALRAGKHVLCEKPMAGSLEECDAMLRAAFESGKLLSIVAQNRYKTPYWKMKQLIDKGALGAPRFAKVDSLWWRGENYYDIWWRGTWEKENGGCFMSHAVHHIDLAQWLFGMPESVSAFVTNVGHHNSECEDFGVAVFSYEGMITEFTASLVTHSEGQEISVQGEKAGVSVPWGVWANTPLSNGFPEKNGAAIEEIQKMYDELPELEKEGHTAQIGNFLRAISGEETLLIDGLQGRNTIELITAVYKASCTHTPVTLPIKEEDVFYGKGGAAAAMPHFFEKTKSVAEVKLDRPISYGRDVGK